MTDSPATSRCVYCNGNGKVYGHGRDKTCLICKGSGRQPASICTACPAPLLDNEPVTWEGEPRRPRHKVCPQMSDNGEYRSLRHVVMFSSGAGSAVAAKRVADLHGTENLTLLFADVNMEHPDNYRFLREASAWVGGELVIIDNDGRTIWDVFKAQRFLGNTRVDLCSRVLKREPMRDWLEANCDPASTVVHLGFDISEEHRIARAAPHWEPWHVEAPLCWEPVIWKDQAIATLAAAGIEPPLLTRQGFPHANCGGGCVKAGIGQFKRLLDLAPDTYAEWERQEEAMRQHLGKDIAILRDRRGGTTRPLTLRELRERIDGDTLALGGLFAMLAVDEGDSCNCMGDYGAEAAPVAVAIGPAHNGGYEQDDS